MCPSAQVAGLHPRSEELIELTRAFDRGQADFARMQALIDFETRQVIDLQRKLGFEYLFDGALYWQDPIRPLAQALSGVSSGTRYSRWFDTNTFYQKPVVNGKVSAREFRQSEFVRSGLLQGSAKWKIVLPGPYSFSQLSENRHDQSEEDLMTDVAKAEKSLIESLAPSHVSLVQLSEPCLVYQPYRENPPTTDEVQTALDCLRIIAEDSPVKIAVHTFFGDASMILERLVDLPVESVGFDLYATEYETLHIKSPVPIVLGIVDSRESHVEDSKWLAHTATLVSKHVDAPDYVFSPNSDLKYLPRRVADAKLEALSNAARIYEEAN